MSSPRFGIHARAALALIGLILWASSCNCGSDGVTKVDATRKDARHADQATDRGHDQAQTPDRGVDRGSSIVPCAKPRTITPTVIPHGAAQPCGPGCKQISWGYTPDHRYEVAGDLLVYNSSGGPGLRVFTVDLKTGEELQLDPDRPDDKAAGCAMVGTDGTIVATICVEEWMERPEFDQSVTLYYPKSHLKKELLCLHRSVAADNCFPFFISVNTSGIAIDWTLGRCGQSTALFLPHGADHLTPLADGPAGWVNGQGNKVVWTQWKKGWGGDRIVVYDLDTGKSHRVDPRVGEKGAQWMPRVQGNKIVWVDHRNDPTGSRLNTHNSDIYIHDLETGITRAVTTHPARQEWPDVYGDWVVWHDWRSTPTGLTGKALDIYAKNMKTGKEIQLTSNPSFDGYPRIDKQRVFFERENLVSGKDPQLRIFMVDLKAFLAAQGQGTP